MFDPVDTSSRNPFLVHLLWPGFLIVFVLSFSPVTILEVRDPSFGLGTHLFYTGPRWSHSVIDSTMGLATRCLGVLGPCPGLAPLRTHSNVSWMSRIRHLQNWTCPLSPKCVSTAWTRRLDYHLKSSLSHHHQIQAGEPLFFTASENHTVLPHPMDPAWAQALIASSLGHDHSPGLPIFPSMPNMDAKGICPKGKVSHACPPAPGLPEIFQEAQSF